jgi:hypothetical protein
VAAPAARRAHRNPGRLEIRARRLAAYAGLVLDAPQRPSQAAQRHHLLFLLVAQDVAHPGEGPCPSTLRQRLGSSASLAGFQPSITGRFWPSTEASRLLDEVAQARADGTHFHLLRRLAKTEVLILDDFGLEVLNAAQRKDLLEVLEDRYGTSSTIVTSQLEPKDWHSVIGDETIADAVCDRLVHNAHRVKLGGESIRKVKGDLTKGQKTAK